MPYPPRLSRNDKLFAAVGATAGLALSVAFFACSSNIWVASVLWTFFAVVCAGLVVELGLLLVASRSVAHRTATSEQVAADATVRSTAGVVGGIALLTSLAFAATAWIGVAYRGPAWQAAAPIPNSPCLLPAAAMKVLVPGSGLEQQIRSRTGDDRNERSCLTSTVDGRTAGATLSITVIRYGSGFRMTPEENAATTLNYLRNHVVAVTGLADDAFADLDTDGVRLYVRRGADQVEVGYSAKPSTSDRMLVASVAVARMVLAGLPVREDR